MAFKITTLIENTTPKEYFAAEHGLSLFIEGEDFRILYDTGSSPLFLKNAVRLKANVEHLDALVLSHGHYDHTGGVDSVLAGKLEPKMIYLGQNFFGDRYTQKRDGLKEIGSAFKKETIERAGIPWTEVGSEPVSLGNGIWVVSGFSTTDPYEKPASEMQRMRDGELEQDLFEDEVVLVLETNQELAFISGCSHVGIISISERLKRLFGRPATTFIGGTHLVDAQEERIVHTCQYLKDEGMIRLGACHCSGERAAIYFEKHFPGFFRNNVGVSVIIE